MDLQDLLKAAVYAAVAMLTIVYMGGVLEKAGAAPNRSTTLLRAMDCIATLLAVTLAIMVVSLVIG